MRSFPAAAARRLVLVALLAASAVLALASLQPCSPHPSSSKPQGQQGQPTGEAYVFLVLADSSVRLALGLHSALSSAGSARPAVVLAGPAVSAGAAGAMALAGMAVRRIPQPPRHRNYQLSLRRSADLLSTLEAFRVPLARAVFVDLETVLRGNPDDLFDRPEPFVAGGQEGQGCLASGPRTLDSGLMSMRFDNETYEGLLSCLEHGGVVSSVQELIHKYWTHRLGSVPLLPSSYSTSHTRFSDWNKCNVVDQSYRGAKVIRLGEAVVDWEEVAWLGAKATGVRYWAMPFMQLFKDQNDLAARRMLELLFRSGVDDEVVRFVSRLYLGGLLGANLHKTSNQNTKAKASNRPLPDTSLAEWAGVRYDFSEAYVFLVLSNPNVRMALGLQAALRAVGSTRPVIVLAGSRLGKAALGALALSGMAIRRIPPSPRHPNYKPPARRWIDLLSKLEVFRVPVERVVYLDLDIVLRGNPDELFSISEPFVASQDDWGCRVEAPGKVNSGVMFVRFNNATFSRMRHAIAGEIIRNGDQELIEKYWVKQLGQVTTLPDSYSTFHTRFSDWEQCQSIDQSFRNATIIHLAAAGVKWEHVARDGERTPELAEWEKPFMGMFKRQNDLAGLRMLELASRKANDPGVAELIHRLYDNLKALNSSL
eukprot:m51a1_g6227 hypothetical protein (652) ;mRNA; r:241723-244093